MNSINKLSSPLKNPLCVALDVDQKERALNVVDSLNDLVGGFKLGPRLIHRYGATLIQEISKKAPVFVDCKFFDIPSTMEAAVRSSFEAGASLVTVHALAGKEALEKMAQLEMEFSSQRPFRILAVTILTSWTMQSYPPSFKNQSVADHVLGLAQSVKDCGLSSIVCSPEELGLTRSLGLYTLTPGIRFSLEEKGDQQRTMSPHEAIKKGAHALVVGRPILMAKNPTEAAADYLAAIYE